MAKCKLCKTDIPDGAEYCQDCQGKRSDKTNESYLDSLLNSVKNTSEPSEVKNRKKNKENNNSNPAEKVKKASENKKAAKPKTQKSVKTMNSGLDDDDLYRVDFSDVEDFDKYNFEADLLDMDSDIIISEEDLYGVPKAQVTEQEELLESSIPEVQVLSDEMVMESMTESASETENAAEVYKAEDKEAEISKVEEASAATIEEEKAEVLDESTVALNKEITDNVIPQEIEELPEDLGLDLDLDELLNSLDVHGTAQVKEEQEDIPTEAAVTQKEESMDPLLEDMFQTLSGEETIEDLDLTAGTPVFEPVEAEEEDFMSLLSQISEDDPVSGDLKAISDMMQNPQRENKAGKMPGDVGEVFSDALTAVSSLQDLDPVTGDLLAPVSDQNEEASKGAKREKVNHKPDKKSGKKEKDKKNRPEGSLFQRLFGNVKNDKTAARYAEQMKKETEETEAADEKSKKKKEKKKDKKGAEAPVAEETVGSGKRQGRDMEEEAAPVDKKAEKKKAKAEKKKAKEAIEIIDEIEEDPGRINRLGATIVFIFFGALAAVLILGTNIMAYTLNIQHASDYFSKQKYTEAYYEVYGVELKDEDFGLYEKIATVMFVNKQLNSYNNYINIKQYPQALDSLLKGLKRYDKYIELATYLGVDSDLNYVRKQILAELNKKFNLTEDEAVKINGITNMKDYSLAVYDVVIEKMNK